jgi:hypothetical protein
MDRFGSGFQVKTLNTAWRMLCGQPVDVNWKRRFGESPQSCRVINKSFGAGLFCSDHACPSFRATPPREKRFAA